MKKSKPSEAVNLKLQGYPDPQKMILFRMAWNSWNITIWRLNLWLDLNIVFEDILNYLAEEETCLQLRVIMNVRKSTEQIL